MCALSLDFFSAILRMVGFSASHVFSFFGLLLCNFAHGRVLGTIDAQHCRCKWFALSASTVDTRHCRCMWFALSVGTVDTRHYRRRAIDIASLHCSGQHPWTPQPSHQIRSSVCSWTVKEVMFLLY
jgi:hypothetical protein